MIKALIARFYSVEGIMKDFHNIIARLKVAEEMQAKKIVSKTSQIAQLEAQKIGHALESERAKAIRTKIEALVN